MNFSGSTYSPEHDQQRLTTQLQRVRAAMLNGQWFTLAELQRLCGGSEAGISARIRDLRKPGQGFVIERRRRGDSKRGLHEYRLSKPEPQPRLFD
jgi:hypothetical protein